MKWIIRFSVYFLITLLLVGCQSNHCDLINIMTENGIDHDEMNTRIKLTAPKELNKLKIGEPIDLSIKVISDDQVAFSPDFGAKIFICKDGQWEEMRNLVNYDRVTSQVLLPADGNLWQEGATIVEPDIKNSLKSVKVKIVIIGNIYKDGISTNQKTAASIDLTLKP